MAGIQSNFEFISSYCEPSFNIEKYQSKQTGMKLYYVKVPLPLIKLEICVQTKPNDDTGCPHTLEHLIFMGSRDYPQQGYLDYISAQHYSLGTNATTYRDMTTYELTTVNSKSLSTLLPVYLDHIFNPLLTKDCYLTEIHHISGDTGDDAGVVYSEMQSSENQPEEILLFSVLRDLWSDETPYHYESGGRLEAIRSDLTLDKIKVFHRKFYVPNNVAIVLCGGGIDISEIIQVLTKFEETNFYPYENRQKTSTGRLMNENQRKKTKLTDDECPFIRIKSASSEENSTSSDALAVANQQQSVDAKKLSTQILINEPNESSFCDSELMVSHGEPSSPSSPNPIPSTSETDNSIRNMNEYKEVFYPVEDNEENLGQVAFGYRLESIYEMEIYTALDVLLTTLFDEDISIFYKEFIELPNTLCSSIDHDWFNYPQRVLIITFEGIEVDNLTIVADKFTSVLYSIINSQADNIKLYEQLQHNIKKKIELHQNEIENEPYEFLSDLCCLDHISELSLSNKNDANDDKQHLHDFLRNQKYLESLLNLPMSYWHDIIKKYLLEWDSLKRTIILLKPSNELLTEQQEQEQQRIADRVQSLGSNGLQQLKNELNQARANNKQSSSQCATVPHVSIPFNKDLHLPPIDYYANTEQYALFDCPTSHFIRYVLHVPLKNLPIDLQLYLPLFSSLLFHTSIQYENIHLDKFSFCQRLSRDILGYSVSNGYSSFSPVQSNKVYGHYIDTFIISMHSKNTYEIYKHTVDYFRYVLFGTIFNDYKIIIEECEKQLKNYIESLQDGHTVHEAFFNSLIHTRNPSNYYHQINIFRQKNLFEKICKQPDKYKDEILSKLESIRVILLKNLSHMHLTLCGGMELIGEHWKIIEEFLNECKKKSQIDSHLSGIKERQLPTTFPATVIGSPHEESGYAIRWTCVPIAQCDFATFLILSNYLDMENGPLWTACRTNGYAYGVAFDFDFENNLILLSINQCSQLKLAYLSAMETLKNIAERKTSIDSQRMIAARNLTTCMLTEHLSTLGRVIGICVRSYLNTYSIEKYQNLLNEINAYNYNEENLSNIIDKYIGPLVNDSHSSSLILVNSSKMKETQEFLQQEYGIKNVTLIKDVVKHLCR